MAVFGYLKFQVCLKEVNISFEPEFGNPSFETPEKLNVYNFQLTQHLLILFFGFEQAAAEKPGVLNLFLSYFFFMPSSKRRFSNPALQNLGSNPT